MHVIRRDESLHLKKEVRAFLDERSSIAVFPVFNLTFKSLNMMKPSPQSHGFIYENQTPSAISDQEQQPSGQGYQGRTGKAINCQSLHRSTSQSTTTTTRSPPPPSAHTHRQYIVHQLSLYSVHARRADTCTQLCINHSLSEHLCCMMGNFWWSFSLSSLINSTFQTFSRDCRVSFHFSLD